MDEKNTCICCLDLLEEKTEYFSCTICKNTFIDNECMSKLLTNRIFCPVCNKVELPKFNRIENTELKLPEISIEIPKTQNCSQCSEEYLDLVSHTPECKFICCPFCTVKEKIENTETFYHNHVIGCTSDLSLKEVLECNKMYHIVKSTFYDNLKKGQRVDAFLKISETTPDNNGLYNKFYLFKNNEKFAFAIEAFINSIHDDYLMLFDVWFQRSIILPRNFIYYIAPENTYVPRWRHLLSPVIINSTNWYEKIKYKIIEKVEITGKTLNSVDLNIVLGYILNVSPDDPNMLIVDFGTHGITYISRNSIHIRPTGIENEITDNLQIVHDLLI